MKRSPADRVAVLTIELVEDASQFRHVADAWRALHQRAGSPTAAHTSAAVSAYLAHRLLPGEKSATVIARSGSIVVAALPLVASAGRGGYRLRTFSDVHNYGADFLVDPEWRGTVELPMLEYLMRAFAPVFSLQLRDIRASSATLDLLSALPKFVAYVDPSRRASYLPVPAEVDEYIGTLSRNFRKNLRKQRLKLQALSRVRIDTVSALSATPQHFDQFAALEASGWKGSNGTAIASNDALLAYYRELASGLAHDGCLEWHFLRIGDELIAANLGVRMGRVVALLKIAYSEAYSFCGPGNMLFFELLRRESTDRTSEEIDCLTDMPWHRNWNMVSRDYLSVTIFPRRTWSLLLGYMPLVARHFCRQVPALRAFVQWLRRIRVGFAAC